MATTTESRVWGSEQPAISVKLMARTIPVRKNLDMLLLSGTQALLQKGKDCVDKGFVGIGVYVRARKLSMRALATAW